jgi:Ran GTPase-activating protein (RanGAP) involved in mRNA processing and transport
MALRYGAERIMVPFDDTENAPLKELYMSENLFGHRASIALQEARPRLPNLRVLKLSGNGFTLCDVTRLHEAFGETLVEMEDNEDDANYDLERDDEQDDELEEELAAANQAPQAEDVDYLVELSDLMSHQQSRSTSYANTL